MVGACIYSANGIREAFWKMQMTMVMWHIKSHFNHVINYCTYIDDSKTLSVQSSQLLNTNEFTHTHKRIHFSTNFSLPPHVCLQTTTLYVPSSNSRNFIRLVAWKGCKIMYVHASDVEMEENMRSRCRIEWILSVIWTRSSIFLCERFSKIPPPHHCTITTTQSSPPLIAITNTKLSPPPHTCNYSKIIMTFITTTTRRHNTTPAKSPPHVYSTCYITNTTNTPPLLSPHYSYQHEYKHAISSTTPLPLTHHHQH